MRTSETGNRSEARLLAAFLEVGAQVLVPFGGGHRYDLVVERHARIATVQCKTARLVDGFIRFPTADHTSGSLRPYADQVDLLAAWCPETQQAFVADPRRLPVSTVHLRREPTRNGQRRGIRWARDYLLTCARLDALIGPGAGAANGDPPVG